MRADQKMTSSNDDKRPAASMDAGLQAHIGRQLRQLYDQLISEPVPDRFRELLERLDSAETPPAAGHPVLETDSAAGQPDDEADRPSETSR